MNRVKSAPLRVAIEKRKCLLLHLAFATILSPLAFMQQGALAAGAGAPQVEEVIVTAQRRSERLENVPMSVTVVSGDTLKQSGTVTFEELAQVSPGMIVSNAGSATQPAIRGVTSTPNSPNNEANVAVYIDGLYEPDPYSLNMDFGDLDSIQILKGPQGTLYGRNATGGAIIINTLAPSKSWKGNLEADYASYNEKTFSGYLSGPISEHVRFGISAYSRNGDGYIKFSDPTTGLATSRNAAPIKKQYIRTKLEADLGDKLTATVGYNYTLFADPTVLNFTPLAHFSPTLPTPPLRSPTPLQTKSGDLLGNNLTFGHEVLLNLVWQTGIGTLTSTSGATFLVAKLFEDIDGTYARINALDNASDRKVYQTNLSYNINAIKNLDLLIGGGYLEQHLITKRLNVLSAGGGSVYTPVVIQDWTILPRAFSVYVDATYHLADDLQLNAGGAYAHESVGVTYSQRTFPQFLAGTYTVAPIGKNASFRKFTPRASLRYEFSPKSNVYLSYSEGFKAGTFQINVVPTVPVKPESIEAYEVGIKLVRPAFRFETAGFFYNYTNIQVSVTIPNPSCTTPPICPLTSLLFNGPRSHIYGADGEFTWSMAKGLDVRLGAAYTHARYLSFPNATGTGLRASNDSNITNQVQDWSGQQMPRAPTFSANVGIDYEVPMPVGNIRFSTNVAYTSSYIESDPSLYGPLADPSMANRQRYRQKGYTLLNGTITWIDPSGKYSLSLFGRNLTNEHYFLNYRGTGGGDVGEYAPPRVIGGRAKMNF